MKKKFIKFIVLLVLTIVLLIISLFLLKNDLSTYAIVFITATAILFIITLALIPKEKSAEAEYHSRLKMILKKYDAILAEIGNTPNLEDKNIMLITNIEDMVDAAIEIRKPVYYKRELDYCIFSLLDNQDMCIYILKQRGDDSTPIEDFINNRKQSIEQKISNSRTNKELMMQKEEIIENENNSNINISDTNINSDVDMNSNSNDLQINAIQPDMTQQTSVDEDLI